MLPIKVIDNFISKYQSDLIVDYIERNHTSFSQHDLCYKKYFYGESKDVIDGLDNITDLSVEIVENAIKAIAESFDDIDDVFLNSLWLVKHLPGDSMGKHSDINDPDEVMFTYSAILYLNDMDDGGLLGFPNIDLLVKPEAGMLVIFISDRQESMHEITTVTKDRYTMPMWFTKNKDFELSFK